LHVFTYSAISAREGSIKVGPGAPLATLQAHAGQVDKTTIGVAK
jgi:hypothetical protein